MENKNFAKKNIIYSIVSLIILLTLFKYKDFDLMVQDNFFIDKNWLVNRNDSVYRYIFYSFPKLLVGAMAVSSLLFFLLSFISKKFKKMRQESFILFFSIIFVTLTISGLKQFTNIYCPKELSIYGGDKPYKKIYNSEKKENMKKGACFPAGHASGGFSLISLFHVIKRHRFKAAFFGVIVGFLMGGYQMVTGSHFLSDTLITMVIAWMIVNLVYIIYPLSNN